MQDIDLFLPDVFVHVANCPEPLALRMLREAARQLCRRVLDWKEWDEASVTTPDCEAIVGISDASVVRIESATLDGTSLKPLSNKELDETLRDWSTIEGVARYVTQLTPNTITVAPKASGLLRARLILEPSREALTLPDHLLDRHAALLGIGAAARILKTPGEHANPQLALNLQADFNAALNNLFTNSTRGQTGARPRTKASFF